MYLDRLNRGFFVGTYEVIIDEYDRLEMLNNPKFDPALTALLEEEPEAPFEEPDSSWVSVVSFNPNEISFKAFSDKQALFVISEMYYPPGWKAYIDDEAVTKIYKTNHAIQSIIFPAGEHEVALRFEPDSYYNNIRISYASTGILYITILLSLLYTYKGKLSDLLKRDKSKE